MEQKNKLKCILIDFEQGDITLSEASNTILRLFSVSKNEVMVCSLFKNKPDCVEYQIEGGKSCINCKWRKQTIC